jgi:hypothetical protein
MRRFFVASACVVSLACSVGEGDGEVKSERLFVKDCWNGPFDLQPTFFGAEPAGDSLMIRVQRGDNIEEVSDGLTVVVREIADIRANQLGQSMAVGLPPGVRPPGAPQVFQESPARVSLALFLNATCHTQNGTIYAVDGSITFSSLFSGDPNEDNADDRLTEASFSASFTDPRDIAGMEGNRPVYDPARTSVVEGWFRFYFQRGQPAQRFP